MLVARLRVPRDIRIYRVDHEYMAYDNAGWIPGSWSSVGAAIDDLT